MVVDLLFYDYNNHSKSLMVQVSEKIGRDCIATTIEIDVKNWTILNITNNRVDTILDEVLDQIKYTFNFKELLTLDEKLDKIRNSSLEDSYNMIMSLYIKYNSTDLQELIESLSGNEIRDLLYSLPYDKYRRLRDVPSDSQSIQFCEDCLSRGYNNCTRFGKPIYRDGFCTFDSYIEG